MIRLRPERNDMRLFDPIRTRFEKKWPALLALTAFVLFAGFSPLLHNHDLNTEDGADQHCVSCHWSHSSPVLHSLPSVLHSFEASATFLPAPTSIFSSLSVFSISNRSPPSFA